MKLLGERGATFIIIIYMDMTSTIYFGRTSEAGKVGQLGKLVSDNASRHQICTLQSPILWQHLDVNDPKAGEASRSIGSHSSISESMDRSISSIDSISTERSPSGLDFSLG